MLDITIIESQLPIGNNIVGYAISPEDSFMDTLSTPRGSLIGNYNYGTDLHKLKHRSFNNEWILDAKRAFKDACNYDKRLSFKSINFDSSNVSSGKIAFYLELKDGYVNGVINV